MSENATPGKQPATGSVAALIGTPARSDEARRSNGPREPFQRLLAEIPVEHHRDVTNQHPPGH